MRASFFTRNLSFLSIFLPEVREFITRHTAYNKYDTGWAKGASFLPPPCPRAGRPQSSGAGMAHHHDLVSEIDVRQCWALNENKEEQSTLGNCLTAELRMPPSCVDTQ